MIIEHRRGYKEANKPDPNEGIAAKALIDQHVGRKKHLVRRKNCVCRDGTGTFVTPDAPSRRSNNNMAFIDNQANACPVGVYKASGLMTYCAKRRRLDHIQKP